MFLMPPECEYLLPLQCAGYPIEDSWEQSELEWSLIREWICNPRRILDLGCGFGRCGTFFGMQFPSAEIYFADRTQMDTPIHGWNPPDEWYNDMDATRRFTQANLRDTSRLNYVDLKTKPIESLPLMDLIVSFNAVGFHFPIEPYLNDLLQISHPESVWCLGIRNGKYDEKTFKSHFHKCLVRPGLSHAESCLILLWPILT